MASGNVLNFPSFRHIEVDLSTKVITSTTAAWFFVTCRRTTLDITTSGLTQIGLDVVVNNQCISLSQVKWFKIDFFFSQVECLCSLGLVFAWFPELKASIHPREVRSGDHVTLECQTDCQNPKIIWFRDGRSVTEPRFQAQSEDSGNYSCSIETLKSLQSDPVALDVWCKYHDDVKLYCINLKLITEM